MWNVKRAILEIFRNKRFSILQIICLCISISLMTSFLISIYTVYGEEKKQIEFYKNNSLIEFNHDIYSEQDTLIEPETLLGLQNVSNCQIFVSLLPALVMFDNKYLLDVNIAASYDISQENIRDFQLYAGNWKLNMDSCIIGHKTADKYGISVGDFIYIDEYQFQVSAITDIPVLKNRIIVPLKDEFEYTRNTKVWIYPDAANGNYDDFYTAIRKFGNYTMLDTVQLVNKSRENIRNKINEFVMLCLIIMIYSICSMSSITIRTLRKSQKSLGIMLSCGSTKRDIIVQKIIHLSIITQLSAVITCGILLIGSKLLHIYNFHLQSLLISAFMSSLIHALYFILITTLLYRKKLKSSVINIIREAN